MLGMFVLIYTTYATATLSKQKHVLYYSSSLTTPQKKRSHLVGTLQQGRADDALHTIALLDTLPLRKASTSKKTFGTEREQATC